VLLILIPTVWLAVVLFALTMCRLGARSDDSRAVALAERIATGYPSERRGVPEETPIERLPHER
jgi:hypothetical protein